MLDIEDEASAVDIMIFINELNKVKIITQGANSRIEVHSAAGGEGEYKESYSLTLVLHNRVMQKLFSGSQAMSSRKK